MTKIRITLRGQGGELAARIVEGDDPCKDNQVNKVIEDFSRECVFAAGDTISIEEIDGSPTGFTARHTESKLTARVFGTVRRD